MAIMRPELDEERLLLIEQRSRAEAKFYRACRDGLSERFLVLFSLPWVGADNRGNVRDGEVDFIIFDEQSGFLVIEIKGGGISRDPRTGQWASSNRNGTFEIKDPFEQAKTNKHKVLGLLKTHPYWQRAGGRILAGHAVFFPDLMDIDKLVTPSSPAAIIGGMNDLSDLGSWCSRALAYWQGNGAPYLAFGKGGVHVAENIFCRPISVPALLSAKLMDEERQRIQLTQQQALLLSALGLRKKAAIAGGAGTGKTLLALYKAQKLAESGLKTLLLCYNRELADHLKAVYGGQTNLSPMSFHQLCDWHIRLTLQRTGRDVLAKAKTMYPRDDLFDVQMPYALALSTEELPDEKFDAIIVDEGQDFKEEYWLPVEMLLKDMEEDFLYIFFDPNQAVYHCAKSFPIKELPFLLNANCRNTRCIHELANHFYQGTEMVPPPILGEPTNWIVDPSRIVQVQQLHRTIATLIKDEKISPTEMVVLVAGDYKEAFYGLLQPFTLPHGVKWSWEKHRVPQAVLVDTVRRYKGLEALIVFLWGLDAVDNEKLREILYVGVSRAKSRIYVITNPVDRKRLFPWIQ